MRPRLAAGVVTVAVLAGAMNACTSMRLVEGHEQATTVCAINERVDEYVGRHVVVSARYISDGSTYTYLLDPKCSAGKTLDVSNVTSKGDDSVDAFRNARKERCLARGSSLLCTLEADVVAEMTVIIGSDGLAAVDLMRVIKFEFR